ncbi:hypothetical protein Q0M94_22610 (plasmid) [Deinococcus radiomollis]|uniref:hypothetical protein n=1 Tax=Deinococcus radiomollis TaxID=468916 RepID=UPI003891F2EE
MYRSTPLPEQLRAVLASSGRYTPETVRLLMLGMPISYGFESASVVEYPDGQRIQVQQHDEFDDAGQFLRFRFKILRELKPAARKKKAE